MLWGVFSVGSTPANGAPWNGVPKTFVQPLKATPPKNLPAAIRRKQSLSTNSADLKAMFAAATMALKEAKGNFASFGEHFNWAIEKPSGCELASTATVKVELQVRIAVLETGRCYDQLPPPWSKTTQAKWVIENIDNPAAWQSQSVEERIQRLRGFLASPEYSPHFLATALPPRGNALCEAVVALMGLAKNDDERLRIAPLLPLDVPQCDQAQMTFCDKVAPEGPPTTGGVPSQEELTRNACVQSKTRAEQKLLSSSYVEALKNSVSMKAIFQHAKNDTPSLSRALQACVENSNDDFNADIRQRCLSSLTAFDVSKARALLQNASISFVTTAKHSELSAAVLQGESPLNRLTTIGLLPPGFTIQPWTSQYPRDILEVANVMSSTRDWDEAETDVVIHLGRTRLAKAHTLFDRKTKKLTVWFSGERVEAVLEGDPRRQLGIAAGVFNVLAERAGIKERWWVHDNEPLVMVGEEAKLKQAVTEGLVSSR